MESIELIRKHPVPVRSEKPSHEYSHIKNSAEILSPLDQTGPQPKLLPPKSFTRQSRGSRIRNHVAYAATFLAFLVVPLGYILGVLFFRNESYNSQLGSSLCLDRLAHGWLETGDISNLLNVDVAFGTLSFGTAKFIDLTWDIVISRGGQALLAWMTYHVHCAALLLIMESSLVSYDLYASMTLSQASMAALVPLTRTAFGKIGFRRKLLLFWLALSIIWVGFWQTITNALTGYVATNNTLVLLRDNTYVEYSELATESNLAYQYNLSITYPFYTNDSTYPGSTNINSPLLLSTGPNTTLWTAIVNNVNCPTTLTVTNQSYIDGYCETVLFSDLDLPSIPGTIELVDLSYGVYYSLDNYTYDYAYLQTPSNVVCIANDTYQWGFSTGASMVFLILNSIWAIGTYTVWMSVIRKSQLCQKRRYLGTYRATIDMAEAITTELGSDICAYSDKEIKDELKKSDIKYNVMEGIEGLPDHIGLFNRVDSAELRLNFGELYG